jgi:hypothetical protein
MYFKVIYKAMFKIVYTPKLGHSSQVGFSMPALQASQNHGSIEHEETDELTLPVSCTP